MAVLAALTGALLLPSLLVGCGSSTTPVAPIDGAGLNDGAVDGGTPLGIWSDPVGPCEVRTAALPLLAAPHVSECAPLNLLNGPPTSGPHYPVWPVFRVYDHPVPWGYLLHGMEHGVVVISYNCPGGCETDLQAAKQVVNATPVKAACTPPRPPVILAPDPTLPVAFTAVAWGQALQAKCFDAEQMTRFITDHANHGSEFFPTDCGTTDKEATGWCP